MSIRDEFEKLEDCPFCGGHAISAGEILGEHLDGTRFFQTVCLTCNAASPEAATEKESIELWNKRAGYRQAQSGEAVATVLGSDPYDERDGLRLSPEDWEKLNKLPKGTKLFAHSPDQSAKIAELQAEIESLRKDAERWRAGVKLGKFPILVTHRITEEEDDWSLVVNNQMIIGGTAEQVMDKAIDEA